jgi:hypothetical protein
MSVFAMHQHAFHGCVFVFRSHSTSGNTVDLAAKRAGFKSADVIDSVLACRLVKNSALIVIVGIRNRNGRRIGRAAPANSIALPLMAGFELWRVGRRHTTEQI